MSTMYEEMVNEIVESTENQKEVQQEKKSPLEFGESVNIDLSEDELDEEIAKWSAIQTKLDSHEELSDEEMEELQELENEAKAEKKRKRHESKLTEARERFMRKVLSEEQVYVDGYQRVWRDEPRARTLGELREMEVKPGYTTLYCCKPQPNAPQLTANDTQDRGGRKRSSDEDDMHGTMTFDAESGSFNCKRNKMSKDQIKKEKERLAKEIESISLWD